jgi:serine/threonine protein phosphatase 1
MIYAIGDIHGRLDCLSKALQAITDHAGGDPERIVFLGDYIDRGPSSKQVVDSLIELSKLPYVTVLKGNHEAMMLEAFHSRDRSIMKWWAGNGGAETIESYLEHSEDSDFWPLVPPGHIEWMENLPTVFESHGRLFVHAGFRPGVGLDKQVEEEVIWIRTTFLQARAAFKDWPHIVHGHTWSEPGKIDSMPYLLDWRTNLDSCAYNSDTLSVGVFDGEGGGPCEVLLCRPEEVELVLGDEFDRFSGG